MFDSKKHNRLKIIKSTAKYAVGRCAWKIETGYNEIRSPNSIVEIDKSLTFSTYVKKVSIFIPRHWYLGVIIENL